MDIKEGEFILILGKSGSGKTTLLNQIGGIDKPTRGSILFNSTDVTKYKDSQLTKFRSNTIGWIFQFFNLIPSLTAVENVGLGLELAHQYKDMEKMSSEILAKVGLQDKLKSFPAQLSGGQQQRVAIARALVKKPRIVVADEPTGNLDGKTGLEIVDLMKKLNQEENITFIVVSHDNELIRYADRVIYISDGKIEEETNK